MNGPNETELNQLDIEHGVFRRASSKKPLLASQASKLASQLSVTNKEGSRRSNFLSMDQGSKRSMILNLNDRYASK